MSDLDTLDHVGQSPIDDAKPEPDDLRMWSVTTIIGALDKPALVYWAAEETAKAAVLAGRAQLAIMLPEHGQFPSRDGYYATALHELGHVRQFRRDKTFPMRYLWESAWRGYSRNRFELEADQFAEEVLWSSTLRRQS